MQKYFKVYIEKFGLFSAQPSADFLSILIKLFVTLPWPIFQRELDYNRQPQCTFFQQTLKIAFRLQIADSESKDGYFV